MGYVLSPGPSFTMPAVEIFRLLLPVRVGFFRDAGLKTNSCSSANRASCWSTTTTVKLSMASERIAISGSQRTAVPTNNTTCSAKEREGVEPRAIVSLPPPTILIPWDYNVCADRDILFCAINIDWYRSGVLSMQMQTRETMLSMQKAALTREVPPLPRIHESPRRNRMKNIGAGCGKGHSLAAWRMPLFPHHINSHSKAQHHCSRSNQRYTEMFI